MAKGGRDGGRRRLGGHAGPPRPVRLPQHPLAQLHRSVHWDWAGFINFVGHRKNTVTGATYGSDRQIALVALAGEPQKPGSYDVSSSATGAHCTITYSADELTKFYRRTLGQWQASARGVPAFTGGLGYLNFNSGIDWQSIFSIPDNSICGIKTYGGMIDFVATGAAFCHDLDKPIIDEEFGWQQTMPDATRASPVQNTYRRLCDNHGASGALFWNLGYEQAPQSYEVSPATPADLRRRPGSRASDHPPRPRSPCMSSLPRRLTGSCPRAHQPLRRWLGTMTALSIRRLPLVAGLLMFSTVGASAATPSASGGDSITTVPAAARHPAAPLQAPAMAPRITALRAPALRAPAPARRRGSARGLAPGTDPAAIGAAAKPAAVVTAADAIAPNRAHTPIIYNPPSGVVAPCGLQLCAGATPIHLFGASEYQSSSDTGIDHVPGTISLAQQMRLNTIRVINFYDSKKSPTTEPFNETQWVKVDNMIAAAGTAGMHVDLSLGDYRNILWNNCVNPYTADWGQFISFVAQRTNTVTGQTYGSDPTIATLSLAGEPLSVGSRTFTASGTNQACTISYTTQDLTSFYTRTLHQWKTVARVSVNTGGLGYLNFNSGIDWKTIFALADDDICAIKTYGGMMQFAPTVAAYCAGINKPWIDEEFGYQQSDGDALRAQEMKAQYDMLHANGSAGEMFWNLGTQLASTTYDIGPGTPLTLATVQAAAP